MTNERTLLPCPFCGGAVAFHQEPESCDGCHHIQCSQCKAMVDLSALADPTNECETLDALRDRIAADWNTRHAAEPSAPTTLCLECGSRVPWIPRAGDLLTEVETGEPCHIEWVKDAYAYVKWDTKDCFYGTYRYDKLRGKFARRAENRGGERG